MTFASTRDFELVRAVLAHPTQYRMASDDATPAPADFRPNEDERIIYILATAPTACPAFTETVGIFTLIPQNAICYEIHAAILPHAWGAQTREALRGAVAWAWDNTPARRIVAAVPQYNRLAHRLARDAGFLAFGRNRGAFLRAGSLHDLILLGISKP